MRCLNCIKLSRLWAYILAISLVACEGKGEFEQDVSQLVSADLIEIPLHFPEIDFPSDNLPSLARISLGKKLFYDNVLSKDKTVSCASCHIPQYAFSDTIPVSIGEHGGVGQRNAPPLHNVAYLPRFFRDGGIPNLELQIKAPIEDQLEMNYNMHELTLRIASDSAYQRMARKAYSRDMDAFVITRSLANFMRTFISGNSKYDRAQKGVAELSQSEKRGLEIFFGDDAKCSTCHGGFNFTNNTYVNNGSHSYYADTGRARITLRHNDHGKFRVPSLRNCQVTAPYMYDGCYRSLEDVLDQYQRGGTGHWNQHNTIEQIVLSDSDKKDLIAFLTTLTDQNFLNNDALRK